MAIMSTEETIRIIEQMPLVLPDDVTEREAEIVHRHHRWAVGVFTDILRNGLDVPVAV